MGNDEDNVAKAKPKDRGRPFEKGNPGRPPGALNKSTQLMKATLFKHGPAIIEKAAEMAKAGNPTAIRALLPRLLPLQSHDFVEFDLIPVDSPTAAAVAVSQILG